VLNTFRRTTPSSCRAWSMGGAAVVGTESALLGLCEGVLPGGDSA
jgi:hypothetical protein